MTERDPALLVVAEQAKAQASNSLAWEDILSARSWEATSTSVGAGVRVVSWPRPFQRCCFVQAFAEA